MSDHDPVTYPRSIPKPHGRLARWILRLEQFQYTLRYRSGKTIPHADGLSRLPHTVSTVVLPGEWSWEEIKEARQSDPVIKRVYHYWRLNTSPQPEETREVKEFFKKSNSIHEQHGVLFVQHRGEKGAAKQIIAPRKLVSRILQKAHDEGGHFGADRPLVVVRPRYFWSTIFRDVSRWGKTCLECQHRKNPPNIGKGTSAVFSHSIGAGADDCDGFRRATSRDLIGK